MNSTIQRILYVVLFLSFIILALVFSKGLKKHIQKSKESFGEYVPQSYYDYNEQLFGLAKAVVGMSELEDKKKMLQLDSYARSFDIIKLNSVPLNSEPLKIAQFCGAIIYDKTEYVRFSYKGEYFYGEIHNISSLEGWKKLHLPNYDLISCQPEFVYKDEKPIFDESQLDRLYTNFIAMNIALDIR